MAESSPPLEISVSEASRLLREHATETILVDVREPFEADICRIEGAQFIPMRQIPESLSILPKDKYLLIHCHHGGRSLRVTEYLRAQGYARVSNVAGGIHAWAEEIEPTMRRY